MVKYAPRKVYIRESGGYVELSYTEFCRCRESDQTYMDKLFIPIQGCLLEVVREQYTDFYRDKERWRYLQKLDTKNRLLSLDGFTDSEGNPLDFITDEAVDIAETVVNAVMVDRLKAALPLLSDSEQELIQAIFFDGLSEREVLEKIYDYLVEKYHLGKDKKQNQMILSGYDYIFGDEIKGKALHGVFVKTDMVLGSTSFYDTRKRVNTHKHGIQLLHSTDEIKSAVGLPTGKVKTILERLFRKGGNAKKKLLSLETAEFYAFVINNEHLLKQEFRAVTAGMAEQLALTMTPKTGAFHIPEQDFYKYDPGVKEEIEYLSNAYEDYTSGYATTLVRSTSEQLFEQYCETRDDIEWVYKNGDSGQQYFSIVYLDGLRHQWLFYADYIVMKKDGTVWVIETKGGEAKGKDKNIDIQIANKFNAFQFYAKSHNLQWGFVRDKDNRLYINNTVFAADLSDEHWKPLGDIF